MKSGAFALMVRSGILSTITASTSRLLKSAGGAGAVGSWSFMRTSTRSWTMTRCSRISAMDQRSGADLKRYCASERPLVASVTRLRVRAKY